MEIRPAGPANAQFANSRAAEGALIERRTSYSLTRVTGVYTPTPARHVVTRSRRHVVCVIAAVAIQFEVLTNVIHSRVVAHIRGTRDANSRAVEPLGIRDSIADHGASLADLHSSLSVVGEVIAAYDPGGDNSCPGKKGFNHGIVLNNPRGNYPSQARSENTQSLDNRACAAKTYAGADKGDRPVAYGAPIHIIPGRYRYRLVEGVHIAGTGDRETS